MSPALPPLELQGVRRAFGRLLALSHVDLAVAPGETLALFGANGAGKTTLLRIAATLLLPGAGRVLHNGQPVSHRNRYRVRRSIGLAGHSTFLYDDLSVLENVELHARLLEVPQPRERARTMLARFGLAARHRQLAGHLSRGLQQRLSLARALLADPAVLLLDEPFSGLDVDGTTLLCAAMQAHHMQGRSAIVCTHDLARGLAVADRFAVLDAGEVRGEAACAPLRDLPPRDLSLQRLMEIQ